MQTQRSQVKQTKTCINPAKEHGIMGQRGRLGLALKKERIIFPRKDNSFPHSSHLKTHIYAIIHINEIILFCPG